MKQTNRATKWAREIRVTSQGDWEWEDGRAGSGNWKPYGAMEADQLQQAHCSFKAGPQSCVLAPPAHWSAQARDGIVKYFDVQLDSQEAPPLVVGFRKTAEESKFDILKIERVQNLPLVGVPG